MSEMDRRITETIDESIRIKRLFFEKNMDLIKRGAMMLAGAITGGHKILLFGNGGSAADAQHIAAEFVNRFRIERPPLAAIALTTDSSILTSIGNDYSFDEIFEKQIRALGRKGDVALGISTSGSSPNVIRAMEAAGDMGLVTMGMGGMGGALSSLSDIAFSVPSREAARVQETHITLGHVLCDLVDTILYAKR